MSTIATPDALVEFVRSYRGPIDLRSAALDLERLGRYGADWPRRSRDEWEQEITDLVAAGLLQRAGGMISVPPPIPESKRQPELHQPWLFS